MSETRIVHGGDLAPPPPIEDRDLELFRAVLDAVSTGTVNEEWTEEIKVTFEQARMYLERCQRRGADLTMVIERVHEPGAAGPGRGARFKVTYLDRKDRNMRTRYAYPRGYKLVDIVYFIRNHLEHCSMV